MLECFFRTLIPVFYPWVPSNGVLLCAVFQKLLPCVRSQWLCPWGLSHGVFSEQNWKRFSFVLTSAGALPEKKLTGAFTLCFPAEFSYVRSFEGDFPFVFSQAFFVVPFDKIFSVLISSGLFCAQFWKDLFRALFRQSFSDALFPKIIPLWSSAPGFSVRFSAGLRPGALESAVCTWALSLGRFQCTLSQWLLAWVS